MRQQVNLYRDSLRPRRVVLPARWLAIVAALTLVSLGAVYAGLGWQLDQRRARLADLRAQHAETRQAVAQLGEALAARRPDPELEERAGRLERELAAKRRLVGIVRGRGRGKATGFAELLEGLGRQAVEGLWLEEVALRDGGRELAFRGRALTPARLPDWLEGLRAEPAYQGRAFATFRLSPAGADSPRPLRFVIATHCRGVDDGEPIDSAGQCLAEDG